MNKVVDASASMCNATTEKVDKLITDACLFMETFQSSSESNTVKANEVISSLRSDLLSERTKLEAVRTGIQSDHSELKTSISTKLQKLQDDLVSDNSLKDQLARK
ncbi:unnamed protein product [Lactuca saligna]|uniref:Uncharacterized protein n=1 Tax=Lactuca saligna TaxID=75948 RepID=A0AA36DY36_LACSI|nr:unnamed protein product [Lactuca saligna]